MMIANVRKNNLSYSRIGILLSGKNTPWSVNRNTFRRIFYDNSCNFLNSDYDIVVVLKKWTKLSHKNPEHIKDFQENLAFLYKKIFSQ